MAELLVKLLSATNPDPVKDARGCYKRGDVVDVRPDGFKWGREECPPRFVVVCIPGSSVEESRKYLEPEIEEKAVDGEQVKTMARRRKTGLDLSGILTVADRDIPKDGKVSSTSLAVVAAEVVKPTAIVDIVKVK